MRIMMRNHRPTKMHAQLVPISISDFDCISLFLLFAFRKPLVSENLFAVREAVISDSRLHSISASGSTAWGEIEIESFISVSGFDFRVACRP